MLKKRDGRYDAPASSANEKEAFMTKSGQITTILTFSVTIKILTTLNAKQQLSSHGNLREYMYFGKSC